MLLFFRHKAHHWPLRGCKKKIENVSVKFSDLKSPSWSKGGLTSSYYLRKVNLWPDLDKLCGRTFFSLLQKLCGGECALTDKENYSILSNSFKVIIVVAIELYHIDQPFQSFSSLFSSTLHPELPDRLPWDHQTHYLYWFCALNSHNKSWLREAGGTILSSVYGAPMRTKLGSNTACSNFLFFFLFFSFSFLIFSFLFYF